MPRMGPGRVGMTVSLPREVMEAFRDESARQKEPMSFVILRLIERYSGLKPSKTPVKMGRPKNSDKS